MAFAFCIYHIVTCIFLNKRDFIFVVGMRYLFLIYLILTAGILTAQDTTVQVGEKFITLSPVVVSRGMDVPMFIERMRHDSSFYKAFKNLRLLNYTAINNVRMLDKKGRNQASLLSTTRQSYRNGCRTMETLSEEAKGDFYEKDGSYKYYTARMYADLFFTKGKICGEDNLAGDMDFGVSQKSGLEKRKAQLKMLFFNPGKRIPGLPFMAGKTPIYDDAMAPDYDMKVDYQRLNNTECVVFTQTAKEGRESATVIDEMITWFDENTMEVIARKYRLQHKTLPYNFDVLMEVQMTRVGGLLVPNLIRYNGDWRIATQPRETGIFTATLSDFSR